MLSSSLQADGCHIYQTTETISSYNDRNSVTFQSAWESVRLDVSDLDQDAESEYFMVGSDRSEDFFGGGGVDNVTGMGRRDVFHLDHINASAFNAKADRLFDFDRNDKSVVNIEELNLSPENISSEIVNIDSGRGLALADESIHFVYDMSNHQLFWNSNGAVDRCSKVLLFSSLGKEKKFSKEHSTNSGGSRLAWDSFSGDARSSMSSTSK